MKVSFEKIRTEGLAATFTEADGWLRQILQRLGEPGDTPRIRAEVELSASGRTVRVVGSASAHVLGSCARCLKTVETDITPQFDLGLIPISHGEAEEKTGEIAVPDEGAEDYTYDGKQVDLAEILNEQLVLAVPYRLLCREDCAGLCPTCGIDLNSETCQCKAGAGHEAFAVLADFKVGPNKK